MSSRDPGHRRDAPLTFSFRPPIDRVPFGTVTPDCLTAAAATTAFPTLDAEEMDRVRAFATEARYADGDVVHEAGRSCIDLHFVASGALRILNAHDGAEVVEHGPGQFAGDIDLLTRRPAFFSGVAKGETTLLRVPSDKVRDVLNFVPSVGEKIMIAIQARRHLMEKKGHFGLQITGNRECRDTNRIREFLSRNFVPFDWHDTSADAPDDTPHPGPVVQCGDRCLIRPSLRELAQAAGIWQHCPVGTVDLAIVGGGPAGITAAVYAASEGLQTVVLDRLGPGGQAGGSSRIENFIGFPAGLSGTDLATRGVLQMLKFGAKMVAPVDVERFTPGDNGQPHAIQLDCGSTVHARSVLIATGVAWRKLAAEGAEKFERTGILYACTAIEARLHEGREVAVVGGGNSAGQAAMFLSQNCCKKVHLLVRGTFGTGMSDYLAGRIKANPLIEVHNGCEIDRVVGDRQIDHVHVRCRTGEPFDLPVGGIFVFIGAEPHSRWLPPQVARDSGGYVLCGSDVLRAGAWPLKDRDPCPLETSLPGLLVAGDVRSGSTKRVGFAVGDGSLAVTCVHSLRRMMGEHAN
jgi:thioredoxin reductase (NADPH)